MIEFLHTFSIVLAAACGVGVLASIIAASDRPEHRENTASFHVTTACVLAVLCAALAGIASVTA